MEFSIHHLCAGEITKMLSNTHSKEHEEHIYDFAFFMEIAIKKFFPILFEQYMKEYSEQLKITFETYLNGQRIHHDQLAEAIGDILERSIGEAVKNVSIRI